MTLDEIRRRADAHAELAPRSARARETAALLHVLANVYAAGIEHRRQVWETGTEQDRDRAMPLYHALAQVDALYAAPTWYELHSPPGVINFADIDRQLRECGEAIDFFKLKDK